MTPKELLSEETVNKKREFLVKMAEKMKELSGIKEAKSFDEFAIRSVHRSLTLMPMAFLGVIGSQYASGMGEAQSITSLVSNAITVTSAAIGGLGTFLDIMGLKQ